MNKRLLMASVLLLASSLLFASISFKGGESKLSLQEGKEQVVLSGGAEVISDSIRIESDKITLTGKEWRYVTCEGKTLIRDEERNLEIRTSYLWFDRSDEILLVSTWFEIDDNSEELSAQAGSLRYDMKNDKLELSMDVTLYKITDGKLMRCTAESVSYDRERNLVVLRGSAKADWKGDLYEAEAITIDLAADTIQLEGRIKGTING